MKVLIVGATGGTGRAAVDAALHAGHEVTAFARHASGLKDRSSRLRTVDGDALDGDDIASVMRDQDAVIVTLGISESALRVRLRGSSTTPMDIRSRGTQSVIEAMQARGVRKLVVQSSYGVGETRDRLGLMDRLIFAALLRPQIDDTERQEANVRASGLDWVIAQPVHLTNELAPGLPYVSLAGETRGTKVARSRVGRFLVNALEDASLVGRSVALSGGNLVRSHVDVRAYGQ